MPLYTVSTPNALSDAAQATLVQDITRIHCEETGAPAQFVQVIFSRGIRMRKGTKLHILGSIRAGRSEEIKQLLCGRFSEAAARVLNCQQHACNIELLDVPASWVVEGGDVMPEPGQEAQWLKRHAS